MIHDYEIYFDGTVDQKGVSAIMGYLDGSTNNIILDAVLTDVGRQFLARNDGSFSIHKFALGDDEVNYDVISKYGRTVGKEKIEKICESMTDECAKDVLESIKEAVKNHNIKF